MKKSQKVGQVNPESAVKASSVDSSIEEGIVAFDHHKPSALEALHTCPALSTRIQTNRLRRSRADQRAPYGPEYDSSLCLLWPRWMAFLGILQGCSTSSHPSRPSRQQKSGGVFRSLLRYRIRFIMSATQPARSPPPRRVVPK